MCACGICVCILLPNINQLMKFSQRSKCERMRQTQPRTGVALLKQWGVREMCIKCGSARVREYERCVRVRECEGKQRTDIARSHGFVPLREEAMNAFVQASATWTDIFCPNLMVYSFVLTRYLVWALLRIAKVPK